MRDVRVSRRQIDQQLHPVGERNARAAVLGRDAQHGEAGAVEFRDLNERKNTVRLTLRSAERDAVKDRAEMLTKLSQAWGVAGFPWGGRRVLRGDVTQTFSEAQVSGGNSGAGFRIGGDLSASCRVDRGVRRQR